PWATFAHCQALGWILLGQTCDPLVLPCRCGAAGAGLNRARSAASIAPRARLTASRTEVGPPPRPIRSGRGRETPGPAWSEGGLGANVPKLSGRERALTYWRAFTLALTKHLNGVQPTLRWDPGQGRGVPAWTARRPLDVLYGEIWDWATEGSQIRKCPNPDYA